MDTPNQSTKRPLNDSIDWCESKRHQPSTDDRASHQRATSDNNEDLVEGFEFITPRLEDVMSVRQLVSLGLYDQPNWEEELQRTIIDLLLPRKASN